MTSAPTSTPDGKAVIRSGGYGNADLFRSSDGAFVEKDFTRKPFAVRHAFGRWMVAREFSALRTLAGTGFVPGNVSRPSPLVLRMAFVPGPTLRAIELAREYPEARTEKPFCDYPEDIKRCDTLAARFFPALFEAVRAFHACGVVHLDLHNARNILRTLSDRPCVLDWQSSLSTRSLPSPVRRFLENIDLAGVCKLQERICPGTLSADWLAFLNRQRKIRRLWPLRGYMFSKKKTK
ncbi:MAG: hypothetical protein IJS32_09740 [Kiritimatiellae bacterium]|nr:hypothetical protein [Kiritimatiellia bacterium]